MLISIVIPVYKNTEMFLANLMKNLSFFGENEIIIVNDDPETNLENLIKNNFPERKITIYQNSRNLGFSASVNKGIKIAKNNFIMLLNSDVILKNNSYIKVINRFTTNQSLFAVSFAQEEKNKIIVGKNKIYWKDGFFQHKRENNLAFGYNAWAEGGSCFIDKNKFNSLGGFDEVFSPFYWEDIDLSYRAWKKGYQIVFDPEIVVEHHHESTISKYFTKNKINQIAVRNQLIFIWKNISTRKLIINHYYHLILYFFSSLLNKRFYFVHGFFSAISKLFLIKKNNTSKLSDLEVLNIFNVKK